MTFRVKFCYANIIFEGSHDFNGLGLGPHDFRV